MAKNTHLLVVDARFYEDISDELLVGVKAELDNAGATFDHVSVPGVLEIPAAIAMAAKSKDVQYEGYVAIGCVIRGETTHYEIVSNESARAIMDLSVNKRLAIGNGIQTVENRDQAWARASIKDKNKGGGAAKAALAMIAMRKKFNIG